MSQFWPPVLSGGGTQRGIVDTASSGSTPVTFPLPFAAEPVVLCTAQRLTATRVVAAMAGTSETGFTVETWSLAGVQVAGRVHWEATGILA